MFGHRDGLRLLASLFAAVFLVLCVGSAAQAAMVGADGGDCVGAACGAQFACQPDASGPALPRTHHSPIPVILAAVAGNTRPEIAAAAVVVSPPGALPERPVVSLASRSPPAAR